MHPNNHKFNYQVADKAQQLIGQYVAERRKELGYTQKQLAEKAGCQTHHLGNFEAGKQNISFRLLIAIFGCLDLHMELRPKDGDNLTGFQPVNRN